MFYALSYLFSSSLPPYSSIYSGVIFAFPCVFQFIFKILWGFRLISYHLQEKSLKIMSNCEASSRSSGRLLIQCRHSSKKQENCDEDDMGSSNHVPILRDEEWSTEGSPNRTLENYGEEDMTSSLLGTEEGVTKIPSPTEATKRGKRQRVSRRKADNKIGPEYFACDNASNIYPSCFT